MFPESVVMGQRFDDLATRCHVYVQHIIYFMDLPHLFLMLPSNDHGSRQVMPPGHNCDAQSSFS